MSQIKLKMQVPLDKDGFFRRQCPHCEAQFKWRSPKQNASEEKVAAEIPDYFCPLCGQQAKADAWWTKEQREQAVDIAKAQVLGPLLSSFGDGLRRHNRPGGRVRFTSSPVSFPEPALLIEPNDMRLIASKCHPEGPVKIPEDWHQPVYCAICGTVTANDEEKLP